MNVTLPTPNDALAGMTALWNSWTANHQADWWDGKVEYSWHGDELKLIVPKLKNPTPPKTARIKDTTAITHTFTNIDM